MNLINVRPQLNANITFSEIGSDTQVPTEGVSVHIKWGVYVPPTALLDIIDNEWPEGKKAVIIPSPVGEIDWDSFKVKALRDESKEPISQWGLNFNIDLGEKITDYFWHVNKIISQPKIWVTKDCRLSDTKVEEVMALPDADVTTTMVHESIANIAYAAGVQLN